MSSDILETINTKINIPPYFRKISCLIKRAQNHRYYKEYTKQNNRIEKLHDIHKGERCFIIGMGPSLNQTDFSQIKKEILFGVNNFYTGLTRFDIKPQYWCVADSYVFNNHYKPILDLDTTLFITEKAGKMFLENKRFYMKYSKNDPIVVRPLGHMGTWNKVGTDLTIGAYGGMVIYSCLQIAYYLGFEEIYLLGCDCTLSKGVHFDGDTYKEGAIDEWSDKFRLYQVFKDVFEDEGRRIYNSTVGGNLEVFERRKLEEIR
jgi:hypothetical protein